MHRIDFFMLVELVAQPARLGDVLDQLREARALKRNFRD